VGQHQVSLWEFAGENLPIADRCSGFLQYRYYTNSATNPCQSPPQLFVINWPVITLDDAVLDICEGDSLEIPVRRLGGFLESSFVSASVEGIDTAKIGEDFHVRPGSSFQIQFDPTEVSKSITIQTLEDAFEEPTEEIRLYLTDLLNATPGRHFNF